MEGTVTSFPPHVCEELKFYAYLYVDPRTMKPFYVGKGQGNRLFSHLGDGRDCEKVRVLKELRQLNRTPILEILKYGLTEEEALLVEATAIDLLDIEMLTNEVRGHGSRYGTRGRVEDICSELSAKPIRIDDPVVLINIAQEFHYGMSPQALYDATRSAWIIGKQRRSARYALAVYKRVVREVYEIAGWHKGGSTMRIKDADGRRPPESERWEFVGKVADEAVRKKYIGRKVGDELWKAGAQNPIRYVGCERNT